MLLRPLGQGHNLRPFLVEGNTRYRDRILTVGTEPHSVLYCVLDVSELVFGSGNKDPAAVFVCLVGAVHHYRYGKAGNVPGRCDAFRLMSCDLVVANHVRLARRRIVRDRSRSAPAGGEVRLGARNARIHIVAAFEFAFQLLASDNMDFRIIVVFDTLDHVHIDICTDLDNGCGRSQDFFQKILRAALERVFGGVLHIEIIGREGNGVGILLAFVEHFAANVDDADVFRVEAAYALGHQIDDPLDLPRGNLPAGARLDHNRRLGRFLILDEHALLGHGDVDPCVVDFLQRHDRIGQLVLKRPLVVDLLDELRGGESRLVEQGEPVSPASLGQSLRCEVEPCLVDAAFRDHEGRAALDELIGDAVFLEALHNEGCIRLVEIREEILVLGSERPHEGNHDDRDRQPRR
ncbi:MAG: hypothetical protein BWZ01_02086 [Deltaproteobacteria bacterium ADurb.BinA179]|nr:MAG: hypothetical protein BWZ01_02086 [Deltaproteobacteria bacterium ADurb.BinA179]